MEQEKKETLTTQAVKGSFFGVFSSIIQRLGSFILVIILTRTLLPNKFGMYTLVLSTALIFMSFSNDGINEAAVRYVSEHMEINKAKARAYFKYILKIKFFLVLTIFLILILFSYPLSFFFFKKPDMFYNLLLATVYISIYSFENFFTSILFAVKKIHYVAIKEIIVQVFRISFVVFLFFSFSNELKVSFVFLALIVSSILALSYSFFKSYQLAPFLFKKSKGINKKKKKRVLKFILFLFVGSTSFIFFGNIDTIMLGLFTPDTSYVGLYRSAFAIITNVIGVLSFSNILIPLFVQTKDINKAFNKVFRYSMMIIIPSTLGMAFFGRYFILLFYGEEYSGAVLPMFFLSFLIFFMILYGLFKSLFSAKEKPQAYFYLLIITIIINILLSYILIKIFVNSSVEMTITGVAVANLISIAIYSIGLSIISKRILAVKTDFFLILKPLFSSLLMLVVLYIIKKVLMEVNLINTLLLIISGILTYLATMLLMKGIKKEDFLLIVSIFKRDY